MQMPMLPPHVVVVSQPNGPSDWSTGLCDCCDDCGSFMMACCCPCIQYGTNMHVLTKAGSCFPTLLYCFCQYIRCCLGGQERAQIRAKYLIPGGCCGCGDYCIHCFCVPCALSQEYRELMKREVGNHQNTTVVIQQQQQPNGFIPVQNYSEMEMAEKSSDIN